jgi:hypothetical protein
VPTSSVNVTSEIISIPLVTSGSLYVGLMTLALALLEPIIFVSLISTVNVELGAWIVTTSGDLSIMLNKAATLAAVETLPVVIPDFSFEFLWCSILIPTLYQLIFIR